MDFTTTFNQTPLIAILRGLDPKKAVETGEVLVESGFKILEVPLNSPQVATSINLLSQSFSGKAFIGGGTVLSREDVDTVRKAGGTFIVSPNCDPDVIVYTKQCGMLSFPGVATPTEAFTALQNGADGLKIFPAELISPAGIKAILAVLPKGTDLIPVGGIDDKSMAGYLKAGATGFGFGSSLFKPEYSLDDIACRAIKLVKTYRDLVGI